MAEDRAIRIISAAPAVAEMQVNELLSDYVPIIWNIGQGDTGTLVTVVLMHQREIRKGQIAMPAGLPPGALRPQ